MFSAEPLVAVTVIVVPFSSVLPGAVVRISVSGVGGVVFTCGGYGLLEGDGSRVSVVDGDQIRGLSTACQ